MAKLITKVAVPSCIPIDSLHSQHWVVLLSEFRHRLVVS